MNDANVTKVTKSSNSVYNGIVMKKSALFIFMVAFFANTMVVTAWAKPCVQAANMEQSHSTQMSMSDDMPCHGEQKQKDNNQHCDGLCLCMHVSINQTPILNEDAALDFPVASSNSLLTNSETIASRTISPPRRPPKFIS